MASIIDRLLGRPEPEAKAATGPGVAALTYHTPWHTLSRDPNRLMAEGQALFHNNGWVASAERALGGRFIRMPWHLEDADGETIDDAASPELQAIQKLMERPSTRGYRSGLWGITFRHLGLSGNAFWYLDQTDAAFGTPLQVMYINPARMTPVTDEGGNVTGWILDHPDNPVVNSMRTTYQAGTPLSVDEVIHFTLDEADWGVWGVGIPEASQRKIQLDRLADSHTGGVLSSGGRLTGLVSPKTGVTVQDDQWIQFVRDWRSITSDPDAAKRLQISKMPVDFTQLSASPKDLQLMDVSKQGRDDILAQWGVPLTARGISVTAGLNSDRSEADEAVIWETIKERSVGFAEKVQYELLDRFQGFGVTVNLVLDYPEFDDKTPLYTNASSATVIPLTNAERRAIIGLDPLEDDELNAQIWIASSLTRIDEEPEPPPTPLLPPAPNVPGPTDDDEEEVVEEVVEGKAKNLRGSFEPKFQAAIAKVLSAQQRYVLSRAEHLTRKPNDTGWWNEKREQARFMEALEPLVNSLARQTASSVKPAGKADLTLPKILEFVRERVGERIKGINAVTRDKVMAAVKTAVEDGLSPADLAKSLEESAAFSPERAEMISRTETGMAYNDSAVQTYRTLDVEHVQVIDGDGDAECSHADGATWTIDQALSSPLGHPNCVRDFIPVLEGKAVVPHRKAMGRKPEPTDGGIHIHLPDSFTHHIPAPQVTVNVPDFPEIPTPIVNVPEQKAPVVNLPAPIVNVEAPVVNVPEAKATLPQEVIVVSMPPRVHKAIRDSKGNVNGSTETDV
jgi:phage portal protein BeeE